jgi:hypothetical protein
VTETSHRIARAHRAQMFMDEFLSPLFAELRDEYTARISHVATTELHPTTRSEAITALSVALKVVDSLQAGMTEVIRDGELAKRDKLKSERIEGMTDAKQRLLRIAG